MAMVRCEGIVLRVRDFNEADRIITVLSGSEGKFEAVARGARRPRSSMAGMTQLFMQADMLVFRGRNLDTLSSADVVNANSRMRSDLYSMAYGSYIAELTDAMTGEREHNEELYSLVSATFNALETDVAPPEIVALGFEMKFMSVIGFKPELRSCVSCGVPEVQTIWFGPEAGGLLCDACKSHDPSAVPMGARGRQLLVRLMVLPYAQLGQHGAGGVGLEQAKAALRAHVDHRVEGRLRTLDFVHHISSMGREDVIARESGSGSNRQAP